MREAGRFLRRYAATQRGHAVVQALVVATVAVAVLAATLAAGFGAMPR